MSNTKNSPITTIWENGGIKLIKTIHGLPYGTSSSVYIEGLGTAKRFGIQTTGSGDSASIIEVKYAIQ